MIPEVRPDAAVGEHLLIEALCCVIPPQTVEAVINECGVREQRSRKLPSAVTVLLCVAMNLYTADALPDVFRRLVWGLRWLWPKPRDLRVSKAAVSSARSPACSTWSADRLPLPPLQERSGSACACSRSTASPLI